MALSPYLAKMAPGLVARSTAGRWVIAATVLGSALAAIDGTVVGIALPVIGKQFHAPISSLQWVVTGYLLSLAALLLVGGTLGDLFGRRRVFLVGVVWFALASAACSLAPNVTVLVLTRVLQGVGAALLVPGSLAIIQASFSPADTGRAIAAWSGLGGVATAAGPLVGGYLITAVSWRWIFVINVPLAAAVFVVAARHVPETRQDLVRPRIDTGGATLTVIALAGVTYAFIEGPASGWTSIPVMAMLAIGVAAGITFLPAERRARDPMVPPTVLRERQFGVTNLVTLLVYAALGGALFLLPVELEVVDGYKPLTAGLSLLPLTFVMLVLSGPSGRLAARIGPKLQMSVGPLLVGIGLALLSRTSADRSYLSGVLPAVMVFALGLATTVAPLTTTAMGSLPSEHAGLASAVNNDVSRLGSLIAVALLPALAGFSGRTYLHPAAMGAAFRTAVFISASWCAAGAVVAAFGIRNTSRAPSKSGGACSHCALDSAPFVALDAVSPPGDHVASPVI